MFHPVHSRILPGKCPSGGFTLMEILISIVMMGIIMLSVYGSYRAIAGASTRSHLLMQYQEQAMISLNRISADLQSMTIRQMAVLPSDNKLPEKRDPFQPVFGMRPEHGPDGPVLHFMSSAAIPLTPQQGKGLVSIDYYLDTHVKTAQTLRRLQQSYPFSAIEPSSDDPVLCESVKALKWTFYDSTGQARDDWNPDPEDGDNVIPTAIGVRIVVGDDQIQAVGSTLIPLPIQKKTVKPAKTKTGPVSPSGRIRQDSPHV
ncbi:MAG: prepilin-type N-terminal cleavage/methylation domain-containing protein [Desulfatirhabdiaceae bacterium]